MIYNKHQHLIFKITVVAVMLALAVALSFVELPVFIVLPNGTIEFGIVVVLLVLPIIGPWWAIFIVVVKPWLHVLMHAHGGNIVIDAVITMLGGITLILVYYGFYWLFYKKLKWKHWSIKLVNITLTSIITTLIIVVNVYFWAAKAYGFEYLSSEHSPLHDKILAAKSTFSIFRSPAHGGHPLNIAVFAIYLPITFIKYFFSLFLTVFLEKPMVDLTNKLHDKFHNYQDKRKKQKAKLNKEELAEEVS